MKSTGRVVAWRNYDTKQAALKLSGETDKIQTEKHHSIFDIKNETHTHTYI